MKTIEEYKKEIDEWYEDRKSKEKINDKQIQRFK